MKSELMSITVIPRNLSYYCHQLHHSPSVIATLCGTGDGRDEDGGDSGQECQWLDSILMCGRATTLVNKFLCDEVDDPSLRTVKS